MYNFWSCLKDVITGQPVVTFYATGEIVRTEEDTWLEGIWTFVKLSAEWFRSYSRPKTWLYLLLDSIAATGSDLGPDLHTRYVRRLGPLAFYSERDFGGHRGSVHLTVGNCTLFTITYTVYHHYWDMPFYVLHIGG